MTGAAEISTNLQDDCPLPAGVQRWNIFCFAFYWSVFYFAAPISYVGITHTNLLSALGNNDTICNLPKSVYHWLTVVPVIVAWLYPHPRQLKPLCLTALGLMISATGAVALTLWLRTPARFTTAVVIGHGAIFGASNGVLLTALWDSLRRGVSTSRRGAALGLTFGIGPLFACAGSLLQDALFDGKLLGGLSFGLHYPDNYLALFAGATPLLLVAGGALSMFQLPAASEAASGTTMSLDDIIAGIRQFAGNRSVRIAVLIYILVYSGGNSIMENISLHAKDLLGAENETIGVQSFLRFGFKAVAGALLGWLLARTSPRATLLATTSILLAAMTWALSSSGYWFLLSFGIIGAGELFGAHFPNYVTTASEKQFVRLNMALLSLLSALVGFSSLAFGLIADNYGRVASFYVATGMLIVALALISLLLPADPTPKTESLLK
jgi:hypothetical protein